MKKILLLATFLLSMAPAMAEKLTDEVAESYSKIVDGWTFITNAKEFMKLVQDCQNSDVDHPKKIKLACDIEYPEALYQNNTKYYIKYFNGIFDGMGCSIQFYMSTSVLDQVDVAFIQELEGSESEVCNIRFTNCKVTSSSSTAAVVVNKVTGTNTSIHDIYVDGGELNGKGAVTKMGGLVRLINEYTTIDHCAINNLTIRWIGNMGTINTPVGIFGDELPAGADDKTCAVTNCYMASTPGNISTTVKFSCLTNYKDLHSGELNQKLKKNKNCFYSDDCNFSSASNDYFYKLEAITSTSLKSGNDVLNDDEGWVYKQDKIPVPAGLFYWNPNNERSIIVGTYGSSQELTGGIKPVDYGRYIDKTPLKLTSINSAASGACVINDKIINEIGIANPITTIVEDVFKNISMTTLKLPGGVTKVEGTAFHHGVTEKFISNGNWRYEGNLLYLNTNDFKRLMTAVGDNEELTIDGRYCTEILDEALKTQSNLKHLYINTWFPTGATVFPPIQLMGENVFSGAPKDLDLKVYVKDGTTKQSIIGEDIEQGYKNYNGRWAGFYSEWGDKPNRLFQYYPVTRNPAGLSTLMLGYPVKLPSDCKAWVATGIGDGKLVLKHVKGDIVPALLPVLLSYEKKEGIMHLTPYKGSAPSATQDEGSIFKGSIDPAGHKMDASEMQTTFYTLSRLAGSNDWSTVAFRPFHPTDGILPSYVAWISNQNVSHAKLEMVFNGDYEFTDPTGITDIAESAANSSTPVYNLSGQRVGSNYRGMIIKNGRKYIAK